MIKKFDGYEISEIIKKYESEYQEVREKRDTFVRKYSKNNICNMFKEEYVKGINNDSFCDMLETELVRYGEMRGKSNSRKYGLYFKGDKICHTKKYGNNEDEAFGKIKEEINSLLFAADEENLDAIDDNIIAPLFKSKLLTVYYPEKYLSILSPVHIDYFIDMLGIDAKNIKSTEKKRKMLLEFKKQNTFLNNMNNLIFVWYLYELRDEEMQKRNRNLNI